MDEHDLRALTDDMDVRPHSLDTILRRSRQIRRRSQAVKAVGATAVVAGLVVAATYADGTETVEMVPSEPPPSCVDELPDEAERPLGSRVPRDQVDETARLAPGYLPAGMTITEARGRTDDLSFCRAELVLSLREMGGDSTVDAVIEVFGRAGTVPFDPVPAEAVGTRSEIDVLGNAVTVFQAPPDEATGAVPLVVMTWTDGAGVHWMIEANGTDVATVQAVAEALLLDAAGTPVAVIAPAVVPPGWEIGWQMPSWRHVAPGSSWYMGFESATEECWLVAQSDDSSVPVPANAYPGNELTTVHGQPALLQPDVSLRWTEPSGTLVDLYCPVGREALVQIAESVQPVAAADPLLPPE